MRDLDDAIRDVMASVFIVEPARIDDEASPATIETWDSLRHLSLILALEERFGIGFSIEEMEALTDYGSVMAAVSRHLGVGSGPTSNGHADGVAR